MSQFLLSRNPNRLFESPPLVSNQRVTVGTAPAGVYYTITATPQVHDAFACILYYEKFSVSRELRDQQILINFANGVFKNSISLNKAQYQTLEKTFNRLIKSKPTLPNRR